jgi:hypothetical protein
MSIFKRGNVYWYHFLFNGEHIQESTKQGNPRTARQIEATHRTALAKGGPGQWRSIRVLAGPGRQEQECPPGYTAHRSGGCHAPRAGRVQVQRVCLCQPGQQALPGNVQQSSTPGRLLSKDRGDAAGAFPGGFCSLLLTPYNAN